MFYFRFYFAKEMPVVALAYVTGNVGNLGTVVVRTVGEGICTGTDNCVAGRRN